MAEAQPSNVLSLRLGPPGSRDTKQITSECFDFVKRNNRRVRTALAPIQPVSLPVEIVFLIFGHLEAPYELQGVYDIDVLYLSQFLFFKPRLWADMPTFQICHATRSQAIKRYGQPRQDSLPFSERYDSASFRRAPPIFPGYRGQDFFAHCIRYSNRWSPDIGRMTKLEENFGDRIRDVEVFPSVLYYENHYIIRELRCRFPKISKLRINLQKAHLGPLLPSTLMDHLVEQVTATNSIKVLEIKIREIGDPDPDFDISDFDDPDPDPESDDPDVDES